MRGGGSAARRQTKSSEREADTSTVAVIEVGLESCRFRFRSSWRKKAQAQKFRKKKCVFCQKFVCGSWCGPMRVGGVGGHGLSETCRIGRALAEANANMSVSNTDQWIGLRPLIIALPITSIAEPQTDN